MTTDDHGDTLVYDAWNRLVAVIAPNGSLIKGYVYDGMGRLVTETNGLTSTDLYYSGTQDIEERQGVTDGTGASASSNGTTTLVNVYSPDYVNDILERDNYSGGSFSSRIYFTHDANYNVTAVIDSGGDVVQRQVYDAYGNVAFYSKCWKLRSGDEQSLEFAYQGMLYDAAVGWYFSGQSNTGRWYSPTMQVWNRPDDAGFVDGLDDYEFVADNPINSTDPTGLWHWDPSKPGVIVMDKGDVLGSLAQALFGSASKYGDLWRGDPAHVPVGTSFDVSAYVKDYLGAAGDLAQHLSHARNIIYALASNHCDCAISKSTAFLTAVEKLEQGLNAISFSLSAIAKSNVFTPYGSKLVGTVFAGIFGAPGVVLSGRDAYNSYKQGDMGGAVSNGAMAVGGAVGIFVFPIGVANAIGSVLKLGIDKGADAYYAYGEEEGRKQNCAFLAAQLIQVSAQVEKDRMAVESQSNGPFVRLAALVGG